MIYLTIYITGAGFVFAGNLLIERLQYGKTCRFNEAVDRAIASLIFAVFWPITLPISLLAIIVHLVP